MGAEALDDGLVPRVPTYDTQALQPAIRQGEARPVLGVEQAAAPGRAMQAAGEQMGRIGGALARYALEQQDFVNRTRVFEAVNAVEIGLTEDLRKNLEIKGGAVVDPNAEWSKNNQAFDAWAVESARRRADEAIASLGSPRLQQAARAQISGLLNSYTDRIQTHYANEARTWQGQTATTTLGLANDRLERARPGSDEATAAIVEMYGSASDKLRAEKGLSGEPLAQAAREVVSSLLADTVKRKLDAGQVVEAEAFLAAYEGAFRATDLTEVRGDVDNAAAVMRGAADATAVIATLPITDDDTLGRKRDQALVAAATDAAGNVDERRLQAARVEVNRQEQFRREEIRVAKARTYETLVGLAQTNPTAMLASPAFRRAPASQQAELRRIAEAGGTAPPPPTAAQDAEYATLRTDPNYNSRLYDMPVSELNALRATLGEFHWANVVRDRDAIVKHEEAFRRITQPTIDDITLGVVRARLGMNNLKGPALAEFKDRARDIVGREQARLGRTLSDDEVETLLETRFSEQVTVGLWDRVRVPNLTPEQIEQVRVPSTDRARILADLQRAYGLAQRNSDTAAMLELDPLDEANIRREYLKEKGFE